MTVRTEFCFVMPVNGIEVWLAEIPTVEQQPAIRTHVTRALAEASYPVERVEIGPMGPVSITLVIFKSDTRQQALMFHGWLP